MLIRTVSGCISLHQHHLFNTKMTDKLDDIQLGDDDSSIDIDLTEEQGEGSKKEDVKDVKQDKKDEDEDVKKDVKEDDKHDTNDVNESSDPSEHPYPPKLHSTKAPTLLGETQTVNDTTFYVVGDAKSCSTLIVVLTNYLGFESSNNMLAADTIHSSTGLPVVLIDSTGNNPAMHVMRLKGDEELPHLPPPQTKPKSQAGPSFLGKFKSWFAGSVSGFFDDMWLAAHSYEKTIAIVRSSIEQVYQVYTPGKIIVVGYGFGARYVLPLLKRSSVFNPHEEDDEDSSPWEVRDKANAEDHILSGVAVNPSLTTIDDFKNVQKPLLFIYSDENDMLPRTLVEQGFRAIPGKDAERKMISQNPPLPHGFAIAGDYSEDVVGQKPQEVFDLIDKWVKTQV